MSITDLPEPNVLRNDLPGRAHGSPEGTAECGSCIPVNETCQYEESTTNPLDIRQGGQLGCHVVEIVPDVQAEGRQACVPAMRHGEQ
jgi:hypothetical protein